MDVEDTLLSALGYAIGLTFLGLLVLGFLSADALVYHRPDPTYSYFVKKGWASHTLRTQVKMGSWIPGEYKECTTANILRRTHSGMCRNPDARIGCGVLRANLRQRSW